MTVPLREAWPEFVQMMLDAGGVDPHVQLTSDWARDASTPLETAWRVACYVGPYVPSTAAAIHARWLDPTTLFTTPINEVSAWLAEHHAGLPRRAERRAVLGSERLAVCLMDLARWVHRGDLLTADYETLWASLDEIQYVGRYIGMKLLEGLWQAGVTHATQTDIRPRDAKNTRRSLGLLFPQHAEIVDSPRNDAAALDLANRLASAAAREVDHPLTWYQVETLLCNFRQTISGSYYPGKAYDSDLVHHRRVTTYFGTIPGFDFFERRIRLFPAACLAEVAGSWTDRRVELKGTWRRFGYIWSDVIYDWGATTDLAHPVRR